MVCKHWRSWYIEASTVSREEPHFIYDGVPWVDESNTDCIAQRPHHLFKAVFFAVRLTGDVETWKRPTFMLLMLFFYTEFIRAAEMTMECSMEPVQPFRRKLLFPPSIILIHCHGCQRCSCGRGRCLGWIAGFGSGDWAFPVRYKPPTI